MTPWAATAVALALALAADGAHAAGCEAGFVETPFSGLISKGVGPRDLPFASPTGTVCVRRQTARESRDFPGMLEVAIPGSPDSRGFAHEKQLTSFRSAAARPEAPKVNDRAPASEPPEPEISDASETAEFTGEAGDACAFVRLPKRLDDILRPPVTAIPDENPEATPENSQDDADTGTSLSPPIRLGDLKPLDPFNNPGLKRLLEQKAEEERRDAFVNSVIEAQQAVEQAAAEDDRTLRDRYRNLSLRELDSRLERAERSLAEQTRTLEETKSGLYESEKLRFTNTFQNAQDKAAAARSLLQEAQENADREESTPDLLQQFANVFDPTTKGGSSGAQQSAAMAAILGSDAANAPTSADGLSNRVLLLNGLPDEEKKESLSQMNLLEQPQLTLNDGTTVSFQLPHNGYILGGGKTGLDCSSLVSSALPADVRKGRFTTLDFHAMWVFRRYGELPKPPSYPKERSELVTETALAFNALDLYKGDAPGPGDLVVYRTPNEPIGHVFIVRKYDPQTRVIRVLEAAQSAGTVRERDFPLTLEPAAPGKIAFTRPGLKLLRLRPVQQKVCRFDRLNGRSSGGRMPASQREAPREESQKASDGDDFCTGGRAC